MGTLLRAEPVIKLVAASITVALLIILTACSGEGSSPQLRSLGDAPSWDMSAHSGESLSSGDLRGKVYLANFIWTNCRDTCPTLSLQMALLQQRLKNDGLLGDRVVLISFSFDPERDTQERLSQYAKVFEAEPDGWFFLAGTTGEVEGVVTRGFGVSYRPVSSEASDRSNLADALAPPLEETEVGAELSDIIGAEHVGELLDIDYSIDYEHQNVFVLVDAKGQIRQYYIGVFLDVDQVMSDVKSLLEG